MNVPDRGELILWVDTYQLGASVISSGTTGHFVDSNTQGNTIRSHACRFPAWNAECSGEWVCHPSHPYRHYLTPMNPKCSGKSNAFGVSYVITEGDKSVDPPPTIEELVEHGNSTWEVCSFLCKAPSRLFRVSCFSRLA